MKKVLILLVGFLLLCFGTAFAFPLYTGTAQTPGTLFEDDNLDFFVDNNNNGIIDQGDVLNSAIEFVFIKDNTDFSTPAYDLDEDADELVAWATIELLSIDVNGTWHFGEHNNIPLVQVYTGGPTNLFFGDPTMAEAEAAITDGTHLWDFSITDDPDTFWIFNPDVANADNPSQVQTLGTSVKVGVANYQLNQVWGDDIFSPIIGLNLGGDGLVDLIGSGDLLGGGGRDNAFATSDVDSVVNPVPEPATMSLLGFGLLAMAIVGRRVKRRS
jgi:hypothetical protein